jgi:hypothetical protein
VYLFLHKALHNAATDQAKHFQPKKSIAMKRNYFNHSVILLTVILSIFISSCSKEKTAIAVPASQEAMDASVSRIVRWGSITGLILPLWADVKIVVYNRNF